jgi:energy-coupling factor transporter ATP-binding protein EcfA2
MFDRLNLPPVTPCCKGLWSALHNVSFEIKGGESCGILSAKGSRAHSSVLAAMFRMVELTSGKIAIDGHDIAKLGLRRLRQALSVLPLQPVLFSGSIRKNLDPLSQHSDEEVTAHRFCRCCRLLTSLSFQVLRVLKLVKLDSVARAIQGAKELSVAVDARDLSVVSVGSGVLYFVALDNVTLPADSDIFSTICFCLWTRRKSFRKRRQHAGWAAPAPLPCSRTSAELAYHFCGTNGIA